MNFFTLSNIPIIRRPYNFPTFTPTFSYSLFYIFATLSSKLSLFKKSQEFEKEEVITLKDNNENIRRLEDIIKNKNPLQFFYKT